VSALSSPKLVEAWVRLFRRDGEDAARSTFFYQQSRLTRPDPHTELKTAISAVFTAAHGRYAHRRVHSAQRRRTRNGSAT
jgi:hypothetical protein